MSTIFKKCRIKTGLNQEEAAKKLGIHPTTLNKYEGGSRYPSGKLLAVMANLYAVPMDQLISNNEAINNSGEDIEMIKSKLALVEAEVLELYRENRMLREQVDTLQKKVGSNQKLKQGA